MLDILRPLLNNVTVNEQHGFTLGRSTVSDLVNSEITSTLFERLMLYILITVKPLIRVENDVLVEKV